MPSGNDISYKLSGSSLAYGISLPSGPSDGDFAVLVDSVASPTFQWFLRYNAGSSNTDKWEFIGGVPAYVNIDTSQTTTSGTYANLTTTGPSFTCPRSGRYTVGLGFNGSCSTNAQIKMSFANGGTAASDTDALVGGFNAFNSPAAGERPVTVATANDAIVAKYLTQGGTGTFFNRWIRVTPIRLS